MAYQHKTKLSKELFEDNITVLEDGCWTCSPLSIYPNCNVRQYRLIYKVLVGRFPEKSRLIHTCGNDQCCNPEHLILERTKTEDVNSLEWHKLERRRACEKMVELVKEGYYLEDIALILDMPNYVIRNWLNGRARKGILLNKTLIDHCLSNCKGYRKESNIKYEEQYHIYNMVEMGLTDKDIMEITGLSKAKIVAWKNGFSYNTAWSRYYNTILPQSWMDFEPRF